MESTVINPWRKVRDITLVGLLWLTLSPLMYFPNRKYGYLSKKSLIWLMIVSPFTWSILTYAFLFIGVPILMKTSPDFVSLIKSFPEFTGAFESPGGWWQTVLISYFLPVYLICVLFLFLVMALTGWSYVEASVMICEFVDPIYCSIVAAVLGIGIFVTMWKVNVKGILVNLFLIILDLSMVYFNLTILFGRLITYGDMNTDKIFMFAKDLLIEIGEITHTNYITANIIVYILPLISIVFIAYLAWINYTVNRKEVTFSSETGFDEVIYQWKKKH